MMMNTHTSHRFIATALVRLIVATACFVTLLAHAHKPSDSYLTLDVTGTNISGRWDLALRDLEHAIGLDANDDGEITWGELRAKQDALAAYAQSRLGVTLNGQAAPLRIVTHEVDQHSDGAYAVLRFICEAPIAPATVGLHYQALFDRDSQHRGLLRLNIGAQTRTAIFAPDHARQEFVLDEIACSSSFAAFVKEGVWHIWIGFDHILFLIALLLPGVLRREDGRWVPEATLRRALLNVLQIVTAFTVAHSITLSLAVLNVVSLPSRLVEASIAASVIAAALNNVWPLFHRRAWLLAFGFGLIHGFGFANVLGDLDLQGGGLALGLLGFNVGVELGQLAIVLLFVPLAFGLRRSWGYRALALKCGSVLVSAVASVWMVERLFNWKVLPF